MWRQITTVLAVCVTVVACELLTYEVEDLRVVAVDFVAMESPADAPVLSQFLRQDDVVLKVRLSSPTDLGRLAEKGKLNVAFDAGGCPLKNNNELSKWPYVYFNGVQVGYIDVPDSQRDHYRALASRVSPSQRFEYDVYISSKGKKERAVQPGAALSYDLLSKPFDVCLRFSGGNMTGGSLTSNTVQVSRDAIIEADERARTRRGGLSQLGNAPALPGTPKATSPR